MKAGGVQEKYLGIPNTVTCFQSYVETGVKLAGLAHNIYKAGKFVAPLIAAL